jgi:hypothetical protein
LDVVPSANETVPVKLTPIVEASAGAADITAAAATARSLNFKVFSQLCAPARSA